MIGTTTGMTMTKPRVVFSARARILAWMLLIVALASALTLLATKRALETSVQNMSARELSHEAQQFHMLSESGDPTTGQPFVTLDALFSTYLSQRLAEESEAFFTLINGQPHMRSAGTPPARLDLDAQVVARANGATDPISFHFESAAGPAHVAVLPVREATGTRGALVIVEFAGARLAQVNSTVATMATISLIALVLAGGAGWFIAGQVLAPIRAVRETAQSIGEGDLSRRIEVTGRDDVAQLAITFNRMLDRLEAAFAGQRKFLDDAGHELRTPITVVRGHLELMSEDPADRAETMRLVNDELARMARLVDDLTLLARSERPDFLHLDRVGLTDLVMDALTHATTLADRRFGITELPEGEILADGQRLLQALMQLVSNAVKHTSEGGEITLGGVVADGRVRLWVTDDGVGILDQDQEQLFDRFNRGSEVHGPVQGVDLGLGIGLEIVARIAEAHRGTVGVHSVIGNGATFVLDLPYLRPQENT